MQNSAFEFPHDVCFAFGVTCHHYCQSRFFGTKVFRRKLGSTARWAGRSAWYEHPTLLDATKSSAWHAIITRNAERLIRPVWSRVQIPPGPPLTEPSPVCVGDIVNYSLWAAKNGCRRSTVEVSVRALRSIARHVNLLDLQRTLAYLAKLSVSESRKEKLATDLQRFYGFKGIPFTAPRYRRVQRLPFIPLESEVDAVISACGS